YLAPGAFLHAAAAQQDYLSANYTHVAREVLARGVNVIAHLVAKRSGAAGLELSFASNPDVTLDLLPQLARERAAGRDIVLVGETHGQLPFMAGTAQVDPARFDYLVDEPRYDYELFGVPNSALGAREHALGLHVSALVRDGGTLQLGIGELGDAIAYALLLRHQQNAAWQRALRALGGAVSSAPAERGPFQAGLFASSEMFFEPLLELYRAGILRRRVYDSLWLERARAAGQAERFGAEMLEALAAAGLTRLDAAQFEELRAHGVFREEVEFSDGRVRAPGGEWLPADLGLPAGRERLAPLLGRELRCGQVLHASFFLGPRGFYAALRELDERERAQFSMRSVGYVNQLYGPEQELKILQRRAAHCINTTMLVTLLGAAVSDTLADGQVVSGVGGQYNFVAMAHALPQARSILCVRATHVRRGRVSSNIVWGHGHETIPRHLRDVVVSEYGVAQLRGRTDAECIAALLNIADSRFQSSLLKAAQAAGKIARDYAIPAAHAQNFPGRLERALADTQAAGFCSEYPFGTDLTPEEVRAVRALRALEARSGTLAGRLGLAGAALLGGRSRVADAPVLERLGLQAARGPGAWWQRRLLSLALHALERQTPPPHLRTPAP
ncbi:MAG: acetyl-CoA hydrolase, partial [Gammaproteobacteria bacterium]|nr:acetyl-CoA hydrolase [Gammaproteobacteria bacterium]